MLFQAFWGPAHPADHLDLEDLGLPEAGEHSEHAKYSCEEHHISAPVPAPPYLAPVAALHWVSGGEQLQASARPVTPSAPVPRACLRQGCFFLVPPTLITPVSGAEGNSGPVLFHSLGFHVMLGRGCQLFTLPGWGSCFPASLLSCGTSPQPLSPDSV